MGKPTTEDLNVSLRLNSYPKDYKKPGAFGSMSHRVDVRIFPDRQAFRDADSEPGSSWSGRLLDDGRVLAVRITSRDRNYHGFDEPEDDDWVESARALRARLFDALDRDPEVDGLTLRSNGNGCGEFSMDCGRANAITIVVEKDRDY